MEKIIKIKNYSNLYNLASIKLNEVLINKSTILICSNCVSLIAGLSFNLMKIQKYNLNILMNNESRIFENYVNLKLSSNLDDNFDLYFEYIGEEDGIQCIK